AGRMYWKAGNYTQALNMYFSFLDEYPQDPQVYQIRLEMIQLLTAKGDLQRALNEVDKLISLAFRGTIKDQAILQKGVIYEEMGRLDEAQQSYLTLLKQPVEPDIKAKSNLRLGYIYRLKGDWARSNDYFSEALKSKGETSTQMETFMMQGDNYFDLHNFALALENYRKISTQASKSEAIYLESVYKIALTYESLADYKHAIEFYEKFQREYTPINRQVADFHEQVYLKIAQNYLSLGDGLSAISFFRQYLNLYPESKLIDQIDFKIAEIYERNLKNFEKAIQMYERFLEIFPQSPYIDDAQAGIGRCFEQKGDYQKALQVYQNFLVSYPGGNNYAGVEKQEQLLKDYFLKDIEGAVNSLSNLFVEFLSNQSNSTLLLKVANINYEKLKNYHQALTYYQQAIKLGTSSMTNDEIYYRMAQCYLKLASQPDPNQLTLKNTMLDSSQRLFRLVTESYVDGEWVDDAQINLAEMPTTESGERNLAQEYLTILQRFPFSQRKDYVLMKLGDALLTTRRSSGDSLQPASYYYQQIITQFPESPYLCQAYFKKGLYFYQNGNYTEAQPAFENFIERCSSTGAIVYANYLLARIMRHQQNYDRSLTYYNTILANYFYSSYADSSYLQIGDLLLEKGEYQAALNHLLNLEQKFNKLAWSDMDKSRARIFAHDELIFKIAQAYEKLQDNTNAKIYYQNYLKLAPNGSHVPQALLALGKISSASGGQDVDIALSYYERLKYESTDKKLIQTASIQAADLLFNEQKYDLAQKEYRRSLETSENGANQEYPLAQIIICRYRLGEIAAVEQDITNFTQKFGKVPKYLAQFDYEKGLYHINQKAFDTAENIMNDIRKKYKQTPYAAQAELALAEIYFKTNKDEKAMDIITQIPEKYPENDVTPRAYIDLADYYLKVAKQPGDAVPLYKKAMEHPRVGQNEKYVLQSLINCYEILSMYDQVLMLAREHLKKYPDDANSFNLKIKIGMTYKALKQYDLAIAQFEELNKVAGMEFEGEVQYYLAQCYEEMGQFERAITEYLKVKYVSRQTNDLPWDVSAQYRASESYVKIKRYDEAINLLEKIVKTQGLQSDFGRKAALQIEEIKRMKVESEGK
ncbi:tetratricopeptide repeat protein, partial [candidate division KSB1 bacterium]|nr:tetratricopeptide repeat protein [candidate division KSB1 bacterium]